MVARARPGRPPRRGACRGRRTSAWSVLGGVARRRRDHVAVSRPGRRADGDRGAGHRRPRRDHPGRGRHRARGLPPPLVIRRIVVALVAVVLVSRVADEGGGRAGLGLALLAGRRSACSSVAIAQISDGHVFGPLSIVRGAEAVLDRRRHPRHPVGLAAAARSLSRRSGSASLDMAGNGSLHPRRPERRAGGRLGRVVPLPGDDRHPRDGLPARARDPSHAVGIGLAALAIVLSALGSTYRDAGRAQDPGRSIRSASTLDRRRRGRRRYVKPSATRRRVIGVERGAEPSQLALDDRLVDDPRRPARRSGRGRRPAAGQGRSPRPGRPHRGRAPGAPGGRGVSGSWHR